MIYAYVVIFKGPPAKVLSQVLDTSLRTSVLDSYVCFENTLLVASELSATDLSKVLKTQFKKSIGHILVLDAGTDRNGWLPKSAWEFIHRYDRQPTDDDEQDDDEQDEIDVDTSTSPDDEYET